MEEFIGFGLVSLVVLGLFLGMKKIFNRKKNLFEYDDEIILDNKIVHYGPFSGSLMYPHRKFIFLLAFSSSFLSAGIDLRTRITEGGIRIPKVPPAAMDAVERLSS